MNNFVWEEIRGFRSPWEYSRFVDYLEKQIADGYTEEVAIELEYGRGMVSGGRWFKDVGSGSIWRLVPPDPPFTGLWEPVYDSYNPDDPSVVGNPRRD